MSPRSLGRVLLGTTALLGAAMLAPEASAQQVTTKAPFSINLSGFLNFAAGFSQNDTEGPGYGPQRTYDFREDSRLNIEASATADNGLTYGVYWRLFVDTSNKYGGRNTDRANLFFDGKFGRVELGDNKSPIIKIGYVGPFDYGPSSGDFTVGPYGGYFGSFENDWLQGGNDGTGLVGVLGRLQQFGAQAYDFSNATKITYLTPVWNGLQAGVSFAPDGRSRFGQQVFRERTLNVGIAGNASPNVFGQSAYQTIWEGAVNYTNKFQTSFLGEVGVGAAGTVSYASFKGNTAFGGRVTNNDLNSYSGQVSATAYGFTVAGGYTYQGKSGYIKSEFVPAGTFYEPTDQQGYFVQWQYATGPWAFGGYFQHALDAGDPLLPGGSRMNAVQTGLSYLLAPGLQMFGSAYWYDVYDDGSAGIPDTVNPGGPVHRQGWVYLIGTGVSF